MMLDDDIVAVGHATVYRAHQGLIRLPVSAMSPCALATAATAASYSARALDETLDITRRFGANTATFHIGTSVIAS